MLVPSDALVDVGRGVRVPFGLACVAAKDAMEVGADFVRLTGADGVALCASGLEERGALGNVTCDEYQLRQHRILSSSYPSTLLSRNGSEKRAGRPARDA